MTPLQLAVLFHETYEKLAPLFGYATRSDTKKFDAESSNGKLMICVCWVVLQFLGILKDAPCPKCGQVLSAVGIGGEYPCPVCGIPILHD